MDDTERRLLSVRALIYCDERFLIIGRCHPHNKRVYWELPHTKVTYQSSMENSLEEDLFKELGLVIRCIKPISTWQLAAGGTVVKGITFLCKAKHSYVALSNLHADCAWIKPDEISDYEIYPGIRKEMARWNWDILLEEVKSSSLKFRRPKASGRKTSKKKIYGKLLLSKKKDE